MRWVALFSQTGSEIVEVSEALGDYPDLCVTNQQDLTKIRKELYENCAMKVTDKQVPPQQYYQLIGTPVDTIVTLNGWLRIVPPEICSAYEMYNGHPGLITKHPQLKGKDPQKKAFDLQLTTSGCIIHQVTPEVDGGEILLEREVRIQNMTLPAIFTILHNTSVNLWVEFLAQKL